MARPRGGVQVRPTKTAIKNYYAMLKAAADRGDLNAAGKLIELDHLANRSALPSAQESQPCES